MTFYINENPELAQELTELALDELESIVGRFKNHSCRAGLLRGKIVVTEDDNIEIRKCFGNKLLWSKDDTTT